MKTDEELQAEQDRLDAQLPPCRKCGGKLHTYCTSPGVSCWSCGRWLDVYHWHMLEMEYRQEHGDEYRRDAEIARVRREVSTELSHRINSQKLIDES